AVRDLQHPDRRHRGTPRPPGLLLLSSDRQEDTSPDRHLESQTTPLWRCSLRFQVSFRTEMQKLQPRASSSTNRSRVSATTVSSGAGWTAEAPSPATGAAGWIVAPVSSRRNESARRWTNRPAHWATYAPPA